MLGEDRDQLLAVADQPSRRDLRPRLTEELLLPGCADDVVVRVPVPRIVERVEPAERLVTRLDVDLLVVLGSGRVVVAVEVAPIDVDIDASDRVDGTREVEEIYGGIEELVNRE